MGKQSQLLLKPTKVDLGLQVGVEFDKIISSGRGGALLKASLVGLKQPKTQSQIVGFKSKLFSPHKPLFQNI